MKKKTTVLKGADLAELLRDWSLQVIPAARMQEVMSDRPPESAWAAFVAGQQRALDDALIRLSDMAVDSHASAIAAWPDALVLALLSRLGGVTHDLLTREAGLPVLGVPDGKLTADEFMGGVIRVALISERTTRRIH